MPRWLRFRGTGESLDVTGLVNGSPALVRYRDRIAAAVVGGRPGRPVGRAAAQDFVERIVLAVFSDAVHELEAGTSARLDRIIEVRRQLAARFKRLDETFRSGVPARLDPDLDRARLEPLLLELERATTEIEAAATRRTLQDALSHRDPRDAHDYMLAAERPHDEIEVAETPEPTLPLEDPEAWPPRDPDDPGRQLEQAYRQRVAEGAPEDLAVRRAVQADAEALVTRGLLPPGTEVTVYLTRPVSQGNEASIRRFEALDPTFLGRGYEVQIRLSKGLVFRADGIHFLDADHYVFLESKEPYTWVEGDPSSVSYAGPAGQEKIRAMVRRDADIAHELRGSGCAGFRYETGHPGLDDVIASEIANLTGHPGARWLAAPGGSQR